MCYTNDIKHNMKHSILTQFAAVTLSLLSFMTQAQTSAPAFPGAEGHARYTTSGGRNGKVYHVTNLNDSGSGSLRDAVSQDNRIIVFDVSGYIDLKSDLRIQKKNLTIAGQTAPGDGITLRYYTLNFSDAKCDNIIVRYLRFRRSQIKDVNDGADASWGRKNKNIILDHCSFSWAIDEVASFYDNRNFTMQWCTLGEALANPGHSKGEHSYGGIWGGKDASFHHNFLCHMQNRVPRFNGARYDWSGYDMTKYRTTVDAERVDFRNCVMYNWGNGNGCYGGPGGGYVNIVNNYYQAGSGTVNKTRVTQCSVADASNSGSNPFPGLASRYYIKGNYVTAAGAQAENYDWQGVIYDKGLLDKNGVKWIPDPNHYFGDTVKYTDYSGKDYVCLRLDAPIASGDVTTHSAEMAYEKVLAYAGASLKRDAVDARYMEEARTGTTTYKGAVSKRDGIIDLINDPNGTEDPATASYPVLANVTRPADFDTDKDGMPDEWEIANGLNPKDANDGKLFTLDSEKKYYNNLEVYINGLVEHITKAQNADALTAVEEYYPAQTFPASIQGVASDRQVARIDYYTLDGKHLAEPQLGICIRRITFADGQVEADKVQKQ